MDVRILYFFHPKRALFSFQKMQLLFKFDLSGLAQSTPQHDKQITVIRLNSSGTFARTLRKPLVFIGKTLKKYVKNSLKYRTLMKTHFNYVFSQIKRLISDICAFKVLLINTRGRRGLRKVSVHQTTNAQTSQISRLI